MSGRARNGAAADPMGMAELQTTVDTLVHMVADLRQTVGSQSEQIREQGEEITQLKEEVRQLQQWEFEIPPISRAYMGKTNAAPDEFTFRCKKEIFHMTTTGNNGSLSLCMPIAKHSIASDEMFTARDEVLPYWKELSLALLSPKFIDSSGSGVLHFSNVAIGSKVISVMEHALAVNRFREITLQNNLFGRAGRKLVKELIEQNDCLECFCLDENPIESTGYVTQLCDIIKRHPSLKRVSIRRSGCPDPSILLPILTASNKLTSIDLEGNRIDSNVSGGFRYIDLSDFLASNPSLTNLSLGGNSWTDEDAIQLATALRTNTTLNSVDLGMEGDFLGKVGKLALIEAMFNSESLNAVGASNHTCRVRITRRSEAAALDLEGHGNCLPSINYSYDPIVVRRMKLLSFLSAPYEKAVNIRHLTEVPLPLMPDVLAFVQQYPDMWHRFPDGNTCQYHWDYMSALRPDTPQGQAKLDPSTPAEIKRLCMVYEIMRGWRTQTGEPLYLQAGSHCNPAK